MMTLALNQAHKAFNKNEVPVGCVIVKEGQIIAQTHNTCETDKSPLSHAEIKALKLASQKLGNWRLNDCEMYVTLEPCPMCLGALFQARIKSLTIGAYDHKRQNNSLSIFPSLKDKTSITDNNHTIMIQPAVMEKECSELLKRFFRKKRG